MSASAIIMMLIACIGLWGGIAVSLVIMMKSNRKRALTYVNALCYCFVSAVVQTDRRTLSLHSIVAVSLLAY